LPLIGGLCLHHVRCSLLSALPLFPFLQDQPFFNIPVPDAGRSFFAPGQTSIPDPGICVSGSTARTNKEYIVFPELHITAAGSTLLCTDILDFEIGRIHSRTSFLHT